MPHVYIYFNGAHWVARVEGRTICGQAAEVRRIVYSLNYNPIFVK